MAGALQSILLVYFIAIFAFAQTHSKPTGFTLKIIPRESPESPLYPGNLTTFERIERLIEFSHARARYIDLNSSQNSTALYPENVRLKLLRDNYFYIVQVAIGTPGTQVFLLLDTGGSLIWTQCNPCINCYPQRTPIFDSKRSSTYRRLPCNHPLCRGFPCVNNQCVYHVNYGGGASTRGVLSSETFTFPTTRMDNIVFGCSNDNRDIQFAKSGNIAGIMGLSMAPEALPAQLHQKSFSYCMVPFTDAQMAPTLVRFGGDIPLPASNIKTTPFVHSPTNYFHLNLLDVSVGSRRLNFPPGTFSARPDGSGGCIIDSGTLIPQINQNAGGGQNAYRVVMGAFQKIYDSQGGLQRIGKVPQGFALCYKYPHGFNHFASMTYHFQNGDYIVDPKYANFIDRQAGHFCVTLTPGGGKTILGAWHQQNMRVTYNGNINALQFNVETCANDIHPRFDLFLEQNKKINNKINN